MCLDAQNSRQRGATWKPCVSTKARERLRRGTSVKVQLPEPLRLSIDCRLGTAGVCVFRPSCRSYCNVLRDALHCLSRHGISDLIATFTCCMKQETDIRRCHIWTNASLGMSADLTLENRGNLKHSRTVLTKLACHRNQSDQPSALAQRRACLHTKTSTCVSV